MPRSRKVKVFTWTCEKCGRDNAGGRLECAGCGYRRVKAPSAHSLANLPKYGSKWTEYNGVKFQSKKEANYCAELDLKKRTGEVVEYRRQVPIALMVAGVLVCRLVVDFEVRHRDGSVEYVEVKGVPTAVFRLKWKLFEAIFPNLRKTIVR